MLPINQAYFPNVAQLPPLAREVTISCFFMFFFVFLFSFCVKFLIFHLSMFFFMFFSLFSSCLFHLFLFLFLTLTTEKNRRNVPIEKMAISFCENSISGPRCKVTSQTFCVLLGTWARRCNDVQKGVGLRSSGTTSGNSHTVVLFGGVQTLLDCESKQRLQ